MIHIRPFKGYRPSQEHVTDLVSLPFDKYTVEETVQIAKQNTKSYINIIKPELAKGKRTKPYNKEAQNKSRKKFKEFVKKGYLTQDVTPCYYLYKIIKPDFIHKGIIASIASEDYHSGKIKKHEQTLAKKEEKLKDYLKVVGINAEPVMFTYPHKSEIDEMVDRLSYREPDIRFLQGQDEHLLWIIKEEKDLNEIRERFEQIDSVYIADGHHRTASSVLLSDELAAKNPQSPQAGFMGIFFPDHNLQLFEFNRLVKDTDGKTAEEIIKKIKKDFVVEMIDKHTYQPEAIHHFGMYIEGKWYKLTPKPKTKINDLDADTLSNKILKPVFGIKDLRHDDRIGFLSGKKGTEALTQAVDSGDYAVAFALFPVTFDQFFQFSDEGRIMPPKTTWFEPKLLNGLVIYDLEVD